MLYAAIMLSGLGVFALGAMGLYTDYKFKVTSMDRREEIFFLKESLSQERLKTAAEREGREGYIQRPYPEDKRPKPVPMPSDGEPVRKKPKAEDNNRRK